jgi:hypothetical protein
MNLPGDEVTIHKVDTAGREMWRWQAIVRRATATSIQVEARYNAREVDFFGLAFRRGDRLFETYFADRWYNIFAVHGADMRAFKGWYCNVARPAQWGEREITWVDLGLDVVVLPDRRSAVLDEEEFAALSLPADQQRAARNAVDDLLRQAREGSGLFTSDEEGDAGPP